MKKQKILTLIIVGMVTLLISAGPVAADVEDNPQVTTFSGTRCRCGVVPGTTVTTYPDGRMKIKDQEALWFIDVDNVLVTGNWWNDMMVNFSAERDGMLHGKFEIFPDALCDGNIIGEEPCEDYCDGKYLGYWKGTWLMFRHDEGYVQFLRGQAKGKGELKGLKLMFDIEDPNQGPGINCPAGYQIFNGYILTTPIAD